MNQIGFLAILTIICVSFATSFVTTLYLCYKDFKANIEYFEEVLSDIIDLKQGDIDNNG